MQQDRNEKAELADAESVAEARNKPEREAWLQDAGFGLFLHWGLDVNLGIVISHSLVGADADYQRWFYEELPRFFQPRQYDPAHWARVARLAGCRYVVLTTKHHSGFCLWPTRTHGFHVGNTPYGKDILAPYVTAVREAGLAVGFYYSPEDWWFLRQEGLPIRRFVCARDSHQRLRMCDSLPGDVLERYNALLSAQCRELMSNYGRIDMLFFDGHPKDAAIRTCQELQPDVLITRGIISSPEQRIPEQAPRGAWESCITMGNQWAWRPNDNKLKGVGFLIDMLCDVRSKGGSLVLNVGPDPDGIISPPDLANLHTMAAWHAVNARAIHGTRPWVVTREGSLRFTWREETGELFVIVPHGENPWRRGERRTVTLRSVVAGPDMTLDVLGQNSDVLEYMPETDVSCRFDLDDKGLHCSVARAQRLYNDHAWPYPLVLRLTHVKPALQPPRLGEVLLNAEEGYIEQQVTEQGELEKCDAVVQVQSADAHPSRRTILDVNTYRNAMLDGYPWESGEPVPLSGGGPVRLPVPALAPGNYRLRVVVRHPCGVEMAGPQCSFSREG